MNMKVLFAGFGGQGVLFAGRVLASAGLCKGLEVSWVPSYGPESRGGTSNCSVVISEKEIGSPLVSTPDILVAMNTPSYDKFINSVIPGGTVILDSTLIEEDSTRSDITVIKIPASALAEEKGLNGLSNMILTGKLFSIIDAFSDDIIKEGVRNSVSAGRTELIERNIKAVELGQSL